MRFLRELFFSSNSPRSALLIDIASSSIGGMYIVRQKGRVPTCIYAKRIPFKGNSHESRTYAMISALRELTENLVREGSLELMRVAGRSDLDSIIVSVGSPWQKTVLRSESVREREPFLFTKKHLSELLARARPESGRTIVDDAVVSSAVDGYETRNIHRKTKVNHVRLVVASSSIEETLFREISGLLVGSYHLKALKFISTPSLRYQALRLIFPHERDFLMVDTIEMPPTLTLVRRNILLGIKNITGSIDAALTDLSHEGLVPDRRFLFADEGDDRVFAPSAGTRIRASHVRRFFNGAPIVDISLLMMGLYYGVHGE